MKPKRRYLLRMKPKRRYLSRMKPKRRNLSRTKPTSSFHVHQKSQHYFQLRNQLDKTQTLSAFAFIGKKGINGKITEKKCGIARVRFVCSIRSRNFINNLLTHLVQPLFTECDDCNEGDSIYMEWCSDTKRQQFTRLGSTIRPVRNQSLCWTVTGHSEYKPIRLFNCEEDDSDQIFEGFDREGKFELHPKEESDRCVSILHHVKSYERIYPEKCKLARNDNSSFWDTF